MPEINDKKIAALSDIGKKRKNNEDSAYVARSQYATLLAVADGMGGHRKGEVASKMIIDSLALYFAGLRKAVDEKAAKRYFRKALVSVNKNIYKIGHTDEDYAGMGSTVVSALVGEYVTHVVCAGDSRCYVYSIDTGLKKITIDQNCAQMLFDQGKIDYEELQDHPQKNVIYNAIGITPALVNLEEFTLSNNSYTSIMLCSDGLYTMVKDEEIEKVLAENKLTTEEKARKLIDLALEHGGNDNVAVSIMER